MDHDRERLRELSARLLRLHRILLDRERRAYEHEHGPIGAGEWFRLVLGDERFGWLRFLSTLIAQNDEIVDADGPVPGHDARRIFREAFRLLKSGASGAFQDKYYAALQDSPDAVMAHGAVSEILRAPVQ